MLHYISKKWPKMRFLNVLTVLYVHHEYLKNLKSNALNVIFRISYFWVLQKFFPKIFVQFFLRKLSMLFSV